MPAAAAGGEEAIRQPGAGLWNWESPEKGRDAMKVTLTTYEAARMIKEDKWAKWSDAGALAVVKYLEGVENATGEEIELDLPSIRGDFAEYESEEALVQDTEKTPAEHEAQGTLVARLENGGFVVLTG